MTRRAGAAEWIEISPGVERQILFEDHASRRRSMLFRLAAGAVYASHPHHASYEECLVIAGDIEFGAMRLEAGDFHVASTEAAHPAALSRGGCLQHISAPL